MVGFDAKLCLAMIKDARPLLHRSILITVSSNPTRRVFPVHEKLQRVFLFRRGKKAAPSECRMVQ